MQSVHEQLRVVELRMALSPLPWICDYSVLAKDGEPSSFDS